MGCVLCIGSEKNHACITRSLERVNCCDKYEAMIPANRVVGFLPSPTYEGDIVIALTSPPLSATRIVLKEGAWELPLPTRATLLKENLVVMFTLMTKPGARIVRTDILEFEVNPEHEGTLIEKLKEIYDNFQWIKLTGVINNPINTSHYRIYWEGKKNRVVFEPIL